MRRGQAVKANKLGERGASAPQIPFGSTDPKATLNGLFVNFETLKIGHGEPIARLPLRLLEAERKGKRKRKRRRKQREKSKAKAKRKHACEPAAHNIQTAPPRLGAVSRGLWAPSSWPWPCSWPSR